MRTAAIDAMSDGCLIADVRSPDQPIVYANQGFTALSGYSAAEVQGRNANLLQGPRTSRATVNKMRLAIAARHPFDAELINYTKAGKAFWNSPTIMVRKTILLLRGITTATATPKASVISALPSPMSRPPVQGLKNWALILLSAQTMEK